MKPISVLIVDDNFDDRYILKRMLKMTGIVSEIFEAEDGENAIEFFSDYETNIKRYPDDFPPMLIFLDMNMPLMGGLEFLQHFDILRHENHSGSTVIMMYTSSELEKDREQVFSYSFVKDFVTKGRVFPEELKAKIIECHTGVSALGHIGP